MKNCRINSCFLSCAVFLIITAGCQTPGKETKAANKTYFDIKGFVKEQINSLNKLKPNVKKEILSEGKTDSKSLRIKDWEKELRMFLEADINKTSLIGTYTIKDSIQADKKYVKYISKEENNKVKEILIELDASKQQAKSIKIVVGSSNMLFASGTTLTFTCTEQPEGKYLIKSYQIDGFQKIIMNGKHPYFVKATIQN